MSNPVRPPITTHVLDTSRGQAAGGIEVLTKFYKYQFIAPLNYNTIFQVTLFREVDGQWNCIRKSTTDSDGRCADLIDRELYSTGRFKLHFDVGRYFQSINTASLYPFVEVFRFS